MNYESFAPINKSAEKQRNGFLQRFMSKLNTQNADKTIEEKPENPKSKFTNPESIIRKEIVTKPPVPEPQPEKQFQKTLPGIQRHSEDVLQNRLTITRLIKSVKTNISTTIRGSSDNLLTLGKLDRGYWMPDSICHKCYNCEEEFSTIKRKHHCRMCGQIFCYSCCSFNLPGSLWNSTKPQRSCRLCFLAYYSQSGTTNISPRSSRSYRNSSIHSRISKSNISPRASIASEEISSVENNLSVSNKNLSFSSNDIHFISDHNSEALIDFLDIKDKDTQSENGDNFVEFSQLRKNAVSEIEELAYDSKFKTDRKISLHRAYHKYFFPANILSREKLFGVKNSPNYGLTNTSGNLTNQMSHKRALLAIWKLIIHETESNRRDCSSKIRAQNHKRNSEQEINFQNEEDRVLNKNLPITVTGINSSKSCTDGNSLVDWIVNTDEVTDRSSALAICQSYMDMQLLYPFFNQDDRKIFKDDATLYVIREFLADSSPRLDSNNQFFNDEMQTFSGSYSLVKSVGNSTFYFDSDEDDSKNQDPKDNDDSQQKFQIRNFLIIKSPNIIHSIHSSNFDEKMENGISQKDNTFLWNRSCRYLERLLKQELNDYNLDVSWCNIILPICKVVIEKISPYNTGEKLINDIRNFIQIKKIPNSSKNDCRAIYSVVMTKNIDFPMKKDIKNPNVILIRSSIAYWRHQKLVSFEPLILQEEEYLKNCVIKIKNLGPDIVVVEGSVSLIAKDMMEKFGLILVSNVRKEQIERLSRMLGATIFESVDSLGANVQSLIGKCSQFSVQKYTLTNGKNKCLLFFKLFNPKHGCTLLLHGRSLSELVRVKYVIKFILLAFKNAYFELAFLMNFQIKQFPANNASTHGSVVQHNDNEQIPTSTFLDIIENRCVAMSVNVHYSSPTAVLRSIYNPDIQNRLLSSEIINLSWKERLNDVLKRKQRHICAELYDMVRMNTRKHPLMCEPELHVFTNSFCDTKLDNKERCIMYTDFRENGSRFHTVVNDCESSLISTVNFDSSDLACRTGFLTKSQEIKWRNVEKKRFESITDSFNPRNYQRILLLYSIQTRLAICEKPRKISLNYYENSDRTLGNFVSSMLNDVTTCPAKCDLPIFDHVYKFISNSGCIQVALHQLEADSKNVLMKSSSSVNSDVSSIILWNWCSRCDKHLPFQSMTDDTWHLSLGRFFDMLFNLSSLDTLLFPGQCLHSLQTDVHYYFTQHSVNKALEIKYEPITVFEFQTPSLFISFERIHRSTESALESFKNLQSEIAKVTEIKTKYNLEIKEKLCKLKCISKEKDNELWDFLKQDSNSEQYSQKMQDIYNLMEEIYSRSTDVFNRMLFNERENDIKDEVVRLWTDIVNVVIKWDAKLSEAFDREDKVDKRVSKTDPKNVKSLTENLTVESEGTLTRNQSVNKLENNFLTVDFKELPSKSTNSSNTKDSFDNKSDQIWDSFEKDGHVKKDIEFLEVPIHSCSTSLTSNEISFENIDEAEINHAKKEKANIPRDSDPKNPNPNERQSNSNTTSMQPLRKLFPSFFNAISYKILEDPINSNISYSFSNIELVNVPVVVCDDSITSSVAFVLSSDQYQDLLTEFSMLSNTLENEKFEIVSRVSSNQTMRPMTDLCNVDAFNLSNGNNNSYHNEKGKIAKLESLTKDRELSVRYFPHAEADELSDFGDQDDQSTEGKPETEDIKIELSTEDNLVEETGLKASTNTIRQSTKSTSNNEFVINLNNNKVRCVCKIYFPKEFHDLRQQIFKNNDSSYIRSLSECKSWATTGGKSGLTFRKTLDDRFIIKQLHMIELEGFRKFHAKYFSYVSERIASNQKCVLAKILGIYHVDYYNYLTKVTEKMEFLVMENVFYNQKPSRIFDLKGNKQGAANIASEKVPVSQNSVLHDKDFINYNRTHPIYVSWQAQIALKETLTRDTDFLQGLPVMDYSLLVGVDDNNQVLVIGIIDYLRMFTMNKLIEMHVKQKLLTPHGELPTVIQPQKYQKRFLEAMEEYFLVCPIPWDHLLLYPSHPSSNSNCNKKQSFSFSFSSVFPKKVPKTTSSLKRSFENYSEENKLRLGLMASV